MKMPARMPALPVRGIEDAGRDACAPSEGN